MRRELALVIVAFLFASCEKWDLRFNSRADDNLIYPDIDLQATSKEFYTYDLFFVNENQGLACTGTGISITLDGGYTFNSEYEKQGYGQIYDFEFPAPATGYAIGNYGLILKRIQ